MEDILKVIAAIGQQWPFLIVLFGITIIIIKWKSIDKIFSSISDVKIKKGDNEFSIGRKSHDSTTISETLEPDTNNFKADHYIKRISKTEVSEILLKKLKDHKITNIKILTYTNEVEAGQLNRYKIEGKKTIEIYKRSVIADLYEQQKNNIRRLQTNKAFTPWAKNKLITESTFQLEKEFSNNPNVKIDEYFFDYPPTKRAYIFNDTEAIFSYYQCLDVPDGSIYKGMGDLDRFWITSDSFIGKYLIDELLNFAKLLRTHSRSFLYEKWLLDNNFNAIYSSLETPVLNLRGVFIDMDGILYDSLYHYKTAWKEALKSVNVDISDKDVYQNEGLNSNETIKLFYRKYLHKEPTRTEIDDIRKLKDEILKNSGKPAPQEGIYNLLEKLKGNSLEIYIVTSSTRKDTKNFIIQDFSRFIKEENIISGLDVKIGKPSPEPYLLAMNLAGLKPTEIVVLENSPLGIESAKSSGIYTIAINTGILEDKELWNAGADNIFKDCNQLANSWERIIEFFNAYFSV